MCAEASPWQQRYNKWKQRMGPQLRSGHLADCTFEVGTEPNIFKFSGHKLVLASVSPVFESMFYGSIAEKSNYIRIPDIQPEAFKTLLEYIYTDDVIINTFDMACELYYAAKKYMLPQLVKICSEYLISQVDKLNACKTYEFAIIFDDNILMEKCIQIFKNNTKEILNSNNFEEVELNTLIVIFSLDNLKIDSEMDLFKAIKRYVDSQEEHNASLTINKHEPTAVKTSDSSPDFSKDVKGLNDDVLKEDRPENALEKKNIVDQKQTTIESTSIGDVRENNEDTREITIRNAVEKIRFLTMTPKEFVDGPANSTLLTKTEAYAVLMNIISTESAVPMPRGLSTSREKRFGSPFQSFSFQDQQTKGNFFAFKS
ncbi:hypothetical protein evm_006903 [Chilo suppressalis]|nr:hypothetical protein evm_006903 [Chilo suppressalis]